MLQHVRKTRVLFTDTNQNTNKTKTMKKFILSFAIHADSVQYRFCKNS